MLKKSLWHLKYTWKLLDIIHLSLSQWHKRKYLGVLVNFFSFCFYDSSSSIILYSNLWWTDLSPHCMLHFHPCWSGCAVVVLEQIHLRFYSIPWLNCTKHFSLEIYLHRHSIKHILWQLKDYMSSSTKTSILLSVKTFSLETDLQRTRLFERR